MSSSGNTYIPYLTTITNISIAAQAVVTVIETPPYTPGEYVSFRVSQPYAMTQMNNQVALVLSVSGNNITTNFNTLGFTSFVYPPVGEVIYPALLIPAGSGIIPGSVPATVNLQDAFDNIPNNVDNA